MRASITAEQRKARAAGKLDQRCRDCGTTSAATSYCCHCHGKNLEYREHVPWPGKVGPRTVQWCEQDNRPKKPADPNHPMSARNRALRASGMAGTPLAASETM